jgi:hypothetical protein
VIHTDTLPGGTKSGVNLGDTLVHEVGHWMGLLHTFEGGCTGTGDGVADTPAEASANETSDGCNLFKDTCPADFGFDPVDNFMDYSVDSCLWRFTTGQAVRMSSLFQLYRAVGPDDVMLTGPSDWRSIPVAAAGGNGTWTISNGNVGDFGGWSSTPNVKRIVGDFDLDGRSDVALTGVSGWASIPIAFARGDGNWQVANQGVGVFGTWSSTPGVKHIGGDFDGDGKTDIALTGPAAWNTAPVAYARSGGNFEVINTAAGDLPAFAATAGAIAIAGDFDRDGKTDVVVTGPSWWNTLPVAFSTGRGFTTKNLPAGDFPKWAATPGVEILSGDFNGDGRTDLALTGPSTWASMPIAFSNGDGTWNVQNGNVGAFAAWSAMPGVSRLVGDFDGDGRADVALTGGAGWGAIPVAFSLGSGQWSVTNYAITNFAAWAATPGAVRLVGDFNRDGKADVALTGPSSWASMPVALSLGNGVFDVKNEAAGAFATWSSDARTVKLLGSVR